MAPISPGKLPGPRKAKTPTATTKTFRFEPFSKRIARLKIDPVHRVEKYRPVEDDLSLSQSHFRTAFDHWSDLNQSEVYRNFSNQVLPLCESLPQLLHHTDKICEFLIHGIEAKDENALEPLLSLVEAFAHDLGERFEKYFAQVTTLVLHVAATHSAADVIEWCFKCMAWTFRFLSRLLVPDLRPLLAIVLPYLGSEKQKSYIVRFAAESTAFLLRKAAMKYPSNPLYLRTAIAYLLEDLGQRSEEYQNIDHYAVGLMTLFSEAALGVDGRLHSSAPDLTSCFFGFLCSEEPHASGLVVFDGTLISMVHQTHAEGFQPVLEVICKAISQLSTETPASQISLFSRILHLVIGTRKGTRVGDWSRLLNLILHISEMGAKNPQQNSAQLREHIITTAMAMQYAPMDQLLPFVQRLLQQVKQISTTSHFFAFCEIFAELGRERFRSLLLSQFQHYCLSQWQEDEAGLCLLLRNLNTRDLMTTYNTESLTCPTQWEQRILRRCQECLGDDDHSFDTRIDAYMRLSQAIRFPKEVATAEKLSSILLSSIEYGLRNPAFGDNLKARFAVGRGFQQFLRLAQPTEAVDTRFWESISRLPAHSFRLMPFLCALLEYKNLKSPSQSLMAGEIESFQRSLIGNLMSNATDLKLMSVEILKDLFPKGEQWVATALNTMVEILNTPYNLKTEREIVAHLRELPRLQERCNSKGPICQLLPTFCMGLLSEYYAKPLQELCVALGEMCAQVEIEQFVVDTAIKWLQSPEEICSTSEAVVNPAFKLEHPAFQCSNILGVADEARSRFEDYSNADDILGRSFLEDHRFNAITTPSSGRRIALQLFLNIPQIAEKRSRFLVPVFLAAHSAQNPMPFPADSTASDSSHTLSPDVNDDGWSCSNRKLFLELFGKFVSPRVLHRSQELHDALLELLTNGSVEIQQLTLKALFSWKHPGVRPYEETLLRLLDGKVDSGELDLLLHAEPELSSIDQNRKIGLMPVLLRLLFGSMISQSKSKGSQDRKRRIMLRKLFNLSNDEILQFLDISFGPLAYIGLVKEDKLQMEVLSHEKVPAQQQYGVLRTMQTMLAVLKTQISPFGDSILQPVLYCLLRASRQINEATDQGEEVLARQTTPALVRNIRKLGLECLTMIFEFCEGIKWHIYLPSIFTEIINPRLTNLAIETAQGVSGLLRLFSIWSRSEETVVFLQRYNPQVLPNAIKCLRIPSTKDEVKIFVLNKIAMNIAVFANKESEVENQAASIIQTNIEALLASATTALCSGPTQIVLDSIVSILPLLAPFATSSTEAQALLTTLSTVLSKGHKLNPRVKGSLLKALQSLLESHYTQLEQTTLDQIYELTSSLFNYFKDKPNRETLSKILDTFAKYDKKLESIARICHVLNLLSLQSTPTSGLAQGKTNEHISISTKKSNFSRLDEVDYSQQIGGFQNVNDLEITEATAKDWQPILYNLLYFSRLDEDFSIRSNAVSCLKQFIEKACKAGIHGFTLLVKVVLLPAFEKGIKEPSESIRADFVSLLGIVVQNLPTAPELQDMKVLLVGNDEEASFFANVLHIQQHRRLRAIRRLVNEVEHGAIKGQNISRFFLPLLERFVFDTLEDENSQNLKGQSIVAISSLLQWVEWVQFRGIFRRYRGLLESDLINRKDVIKLLNGTADALSNAVEEKRGLSSSDTTLPSSLGASLPSASTISTELRTHFISKLTDYTKHNDEAQASLRLPAAVVTIKLLQLLPQEEAAHEIPAVLLDICNVLRSRAQEIRDEARNTLADVAILLGPAYVHLIVKELRTALSRGYQLHVLTYTMHKVVVSVMPNVQPGQLDYCLPDLTSVVMDDVFGPVGLEKDNDDYVSSMKEVRGNKKNSKSFGVIETLARLASIRQVPRLIEPLRTLLTGTLNSKQLQHVDDILRRIGSGLVQNTAAGTRDMLMLAYELIQDLYKEKEITLAGASSNDEVNRQRFLIQLRNSHKSTQGTTSPLLYKIHRFALDILRSTLQRHQDLLTAENLHGFLPIIGESLIGQQQDVKTSALRLLSSIIKLPIPELDQNSVLYVREAVQTVESSTNTNNEAPQAALKLVASILRERPEVEVLTEDVAYLLRKVAPELEEPDRQGASFNLVKAVMVREVRAQKFELPEMYELADKISAIMVVNHSQSARDIARGVYVHFLLEYPQAKKRWEKQLRFLAENLEYKYPEGRQSVMEAINVLIAKTSGDRTQEIVSWFFLPVVLQLANDESQSCREMAGVLLAQLFKKADAAEMEKMLYSMREWIEQTREPALTIAGMQAYGHFFEIGGLEKEAPHVRSCIEQILMSDSADEGDAEMDELNVQALTLMAKLVAMTPGMVMTQKQSQLWSVIRFSLSSSDRKVQSLSATLISTLFQDIVNANSKAKPKLDALPLVGSHGLQLNKSDMTELLRSCLGILSNLDGTSATLGTSIVRNLIFLGRCFSLNNASISISQSVRSGSQYASDSNSQGDEKGLEGVLRPISIPAIAYLLHQLSAILRREPRNLTSTALQPKLSSLHLLLAFLPYLPPTALSTPQTLMTVLLPLRHLTDDSLVAPRSGDPDYAATLANLKEAAREVMEAVKKAVGDPQYVQAMTQVSRNVRDRREERRSKRRIEGVVDPEKRAGEKRRKNERKRDRRKEIGQMHRTRRNML